SRVGRHEWGDHPVDLGLEWWLAGGRLRSRAPGRALRSTSLTSYDCFSWRSLFCESFLPLNSLSQTRDSGNFVNSYHRPLDAGIGGCDHTSRCVADRELSQNFRVTA